MDRHTTARCCDDDDSWNSNASKKSEEVIGPTSLEQYENLTRPGIQSNMRYILQSTDCSASDCDEQEATTGPF